jgi:hypothetical protein
MKRPIVRLLLALLVWGVASCGDPATSPARRLQLEASVVNPTLSTGDATRFAASVRNAGPTPIILALSCSGRSYIADATGRVVYPPGGVWGCLANIVTITIEPGREYTWGFEIRARSAFAMGGEWVALPPGLYRAYTEFGAFVGTDYRETVRLESGDVPFAIAP